MRPAGIEARCRAGGSADEPGAAAREGRARSDLQEAAGRVTNRPPQEKATTSGTIRAASAIAIESADTQTAQSWRLRSCQSDAGRLRAA
jgi:hypothetical protein